MLVLFLSRGAMQRAKEEAHILNKIPTALRRANSVNVEGFSSQAAVACLSNNLEQSPMPDEKNEAKNKISNAEETVGSSLVLLCSVDCSDVVLSGAMSLERLQQLLLDT